MRIAQLVGNLEAEPLCGMSISGWWGQAGGDGGCGGHLSKQFSSVT